MKIQNRKQAGIALGLKLKAKNFPNPVILALPCGGVPVASPIAAALHTPMDVFLARKLGSPRQPEFALGAITEDMTLWLNDEFVTPFHFESKGLDDIIKKEWERIQTQKYLFREGHSLPNLKDKTVILVDDGIATGATVLATLKSIKKHQPAKMVVAVPICSSDAAILVREAGAELLSLITTDALHSVGSWYEDFEPVEDSEVIQILKKFRKQPEQLASQAHQN